MAFRFDRILLFGEGIVPWKKFDHPQYGEIEIGGLKKAWVRTAPSFMIEERATATWPSPSSTPTTCRL
jgi:hypothetical protein